MAFATLVLIATAVAVIALLSNGAEDYFRTGAGNEAVFESHGFATPSNLQVSQASTFEYEAGRSSLVPSALANVSH